MKAFCIVESGIEESCAKELKEIQAKGILIEPRTVTFSSDIKNILTFCYRSQSANRICLSLCTFIAETTEEATLKNVEIALQKGDPVFFAQKPVIRVDCQREGAHSYSSMDIERSIGEAVIEKYKLKGASMQKPDLIIYAHIHNNKGYLGIDLCGKNLAKRDYKIFSHPSTIRGPVAYAILRYTGYKPRHVLLDPFCGAGTIPIEAALFSSNTSPHFHSKNLAFLKLPLFKKYHHLFDKITIKDATKKRIFASDKELRNVKATQKNAKIAGIDKNLETSRCDIEWLDTKFEKSSVDLIITEPPHESKRTNEKELEKTYKEFFYQAEFILKKTGKIAMLCIRPNSIYDIAERTPFTLTEEKSIHSGKQEHILLIFKR